MALFKVAIVEHPTKKQAEDGVVEKLVFGPKAVIANDAQTAAIAATRGDELKTVELRRIKVFVRPFVA